MTYRKRVFRSREKASGRRAGRIHGSSSKQYPYGAKAMSTKTAVDFDQAAERPSRPTPSHRTPTPYEVVEADGVKNAEYTKPQFKRSHELAADSEAKAQGAIVHGKISGDCIESEPGFENAKRRFAAIHKNRLATAQMFDSLRKKSSSV
jgi:hypothetical protein